MNLQFDSRGNLTQQSPIQIEIEVFEEEFVFNEERKLLFDNYVKYNNYLKITMMPAVHDMQKDLINAITENLEWVVRTEQMIFAKKQEKDKFGVAQYQTQKENLLQDLKELYKELDIEIEFKVIAK